ncbi:MAG: Na/Pi cotransporter family protein [bacterium]|nr:Na/Pi cotransporter family protein [bacterium]
MPQTFSFLVFLGALAIFIYGMQVGRIGLQLAGGNRLRAIISSITQNRLYGLGVGAITTLILQSSSVTTVMLVGLAGSQIINLTQAMAVILGADIGTSLIVFLFSIKKIAEYSLMILILGVLIDLFGKKKKTRYLSMILLGFGFVFFGLNLMIQSMVPLQQSEWIPQMMSLLEKHPFYNLLFATAFTAIVHSSTTTVGLAIALAFAGTLSIEAAVPIIFGANIGTCGTALIASVGGMTNGKRVAVAHLIFKVGGVILFFPFMKPLVFVATELSHLISWNGPCIPLQIATIHFLFNGTLSLLFLPFIRQGVWLVQKILPESENDKKKRFQPQYLALSALETPSLAFSHVKREILRMMDIAYEMFEEIPAVFEKNDLDRIEQLKSKDDQLDILNREIKFYLAKLSQSSLTAHEAETELNYLSMVEDLEEIGDIINRHIMDLAEKKIQKVREFSKDGKKEIKEFHTKVLENFDLAIAAITSSDESFAKKVIRHDENMRGFEKELHQTHLNRLHQGLKETFETSSIHLDLLSNLQRINNKISSIVTHAFPVLAPALISAESEKQ